MSTHKDNVLAVQFIHFSIFSMKMVHTILNKSYLLLQKLKWMQGKRIKYFLFDNVLSIYIKKNTCFGSLIEKNSVIDSFNTFWNTIAIYIKYYLDDSNPRGLYFSPFTCTKRTVLNK